jgi:hypothetical protein
LDWVAQANCCWMTSVACTVGDSLTVHPDSLLFYQCDVAFIREAKLNGVLGYHLPAAGCPLRLIWVRKSVVLYIEFRV